MNSNLNSTVSSNIFSEYVNAHKQKLQHEQQLTHVKNPNKQLNEIESESSIAFSSFLQSRLNSNKTPKISEIRFTSEEDDIEYRTISEGDDKLNNDQDRKPLSKTFFNSTTSSSLFSKNSLNKESSGASELIKLLSCKHNYYSDDDDIEI